MIARVWIRLLLGTFPRPFRERFGAEMERAFEERWSPTDEGASPSGAPDTRIPFSAASVDSARRPRRASVLQRVTLLFRTTLDLLTSSLAERMHPTVTSRTSRAPRASALSWLGQDLRLAVRSLRRRPGFALVAIVTLALGTGANTAIFSVVNGVLLRPLPWPDQERLVTVWSTSQENPTQRGSISRPDLLDLAESGVFESAVGYSSANDALTGFGSAEAIDVVRVTSGMLALFGLTPEVGRDLTLADTEEGASEVVVLTHAFWVDRLGGDPDVVGRTIELRGRPYRVVGVAPAGFAYPANVQLWRPFPYDPVGCARGCTNLTGLARLAPDLTPEAAQAKTEVLAAGLRETYPETNFGRRFQLVTLEETTVGNTVRDGLWVMLGAVAFVLLIACANVANLLLARAQSRTQEVAVRSALGAGSGRLAAQVMTESLVLAAAGGAAGLLLAVGGVALLRRLAQGTIPRVAEVDVDGTVLVFALGMTTLVGLLFGIGPALRVARGAPARGLGSASRTVSSSRSSSRSRSALLVGEVALSLILLAGAGLLLESFAHLYAVDPGYETRDIVRFSLTLPETTYPELDRITAFYRQLEERIAAEPGVVSVGSGFGGPLSRGSMGGDVRVEGRPEPTSGQEKSVSVKAVTAGYLATMGVPVLRGRGIEASDDLASTPVALVNEEYVRQNFPGEDPLGARIRVTANFDFTKPTFTIVGIVPDLKTTSLTADPQSEMYVPQAQFGPGSMTVAVRLAPGAPPIVAALRAAVAGVDPDIPLRSLETMQEVVGRQRAPTRFFLSLVGLFAALGVVLAATGLYGVAVYLASRRRREVGIRIALGAGRTDIVGLLLGNGLKPALVGVAIGLAGAWLTTRYLERLLFQVEPTDPFVFAGVSLLLVAVVVAACLMPAREASRVDPVDALRADL